MITPFTLQTTTFFLGLLLILFPGVNMNAQTCINNPSIQQGNINPAPLNTNTGVLQFSFFENLLDYTAWQTDPLTMTVCLLHISPQNGAASVGGNYAPTFNWLYDQSSNCLQGTQNQTIFGGTGGLITVAFKVDNPIGCPNNQMVLIRIFSHPLV